MGGRTDVWRMRCAATPIYRRTRRWQPPGRHCSRRSNAWTDALDPARVERARCLRRSEIAAVAESVIASGAIRNEHQAWPAATEEIRLLADCIGAALVRTVPLDLNPGNVIVSPDGIVFVDLEAFGLDFAHWSLCKATMLPHAPASASPGRSLVAHEKIDRHGQRGGTESTVAIDRRIWASALLLALADAAGLWRSEPAHPAGLTLVREFERADLKTFRILPLLWSRLWYTTQGINP